MYRAKRKRSGCAERRICRRGCREAGRNRVQIVARAYGKITAHCLQHVTVRHQRACTHTYSATLRCVSIRVSAQSPKRRKRIRCVLPPGDCFLPRRLNSATSKDKLANDRGASSNESNDKMKYRVDILSTQGGRWSRNPISMTLDLNTSYQPETS